MPKRFIQKISPDPEKLKKHKYLKVFGVLLHDPNLWHFNRRSISGAFAVGIFCAFIPVPFQMIFAAAGAMLFHVNLPVSVLMVWLSNPVTMPAMFYGCYLLGAWILQTPPQAFEFELSWQWLTESLAHIGEPFLLGCLIAGAVSSLTGYFGIRIFWRLLMIKKWNSRKFRKISFRKE
ncbi:MAG: DUF2062 domain-containing protein [Gammaproteobacteria bacterium]|nr:DUF2062 domain-containing protein [Gammaproteobacteria bacterium]